MRHIAIALFLTSTIMWPVLAQPNHVTPDMVKAEFLHAWKCYATYAWGADAVKPLSKKPHNWYGQSLLLTPVDAYDTMLLMELKDEAAATKKLILDSLRFDRDMEVQVFEVNIRLLGGLLTAYEMDGDPRFLALAKDLGDRLLPSFNTPTGIPCRYVNLRTGAIRDSMNNPAEIGTMLIEYGVLSKHTQDPKYYAAAKKAMTGVFNRRSGIGLVGTVIDAATGRWMNAESHIGGMIDSYYEYLLKSWLLFGDTDCKRMYDESVVAVNRFVADSARGGLWYGIVDMNTGKKIRSEFGSLEAFWPAVLALGGDMGRARRLEESCYAMWMKHGIEPEGYDYAADTVTSGGYYLRPEIIESAYVLRELTGDSRYREMGETFFRSLVQYCRSEYGYAFLRDVRTKVKGDGMESFFFAETLKYLYLLMSPRGTIDLSTGVFNTEAHFVVR